MQKNLIFTADDKKVELIVSTRFGVGVQDDNWFENRFKLLEAITISSLFSQTDRDFKWLIFVGAKSKDWVVDKLEKMLSVFNGSAVVIREVQSASSINKFAKKNFTSDFMLTALLDDDDAWDVNTVKRIKSIANEMIDRGVERCGFTFENGYEWLISDLVDVDALLNKNIKVLRESAIYKYSRPFLNISCFVLSENGNLFDRFCNIHSSFGEILSDCGFEKIVFNDENPAWLYVRHHQADSSIRKAHGTEKINVDINELVELFGINSKAVRAYQDESNNFSYAIKRVHGLEDKSNITFKIENLNDFLPIKKQKPVINPGVNGYSFNAAKDFGVTDDLCRVVVYDNIKGEFCFIGEVHSDVVFTLAFESLPEHLDCKLKLQTKIDKKWVDFLKYIPLVKPGSERLQ